MTENVIQSLWIRGPLSTMERLCIESFLQNEHAFRLWSYGAVPNLPDGAVLADANEIIPESAVFTNAGAGFGMGGFAGFSDWFRYEMLAKVGGWWVDTDIVAIRSFDIGAGSVVASSFEGKWGAVAVGCVMRLAPNDPLLEYCLAVCRRSTLANLEFGAIGPHLIQSGIRELGLDYAVSPEVFCPIGWGHVPFMVQSSWSVRYFNLKRRVRGGR